MKYVFAIVFALLIAASVVTSWFTPEKQTALPVLYWVTDPNPARKEQVRRFREWLAKNNYPRMELRLDTANRDVSKMIIQGVSGVGGDIMDIGSGGGMRYFHSVGLLTDVTQWAKQLHFDPSYTYPALEPEITLDGRQYMFPCNVYAHMYWVNKATFKKYGCQIPPRRWDFNEFERRGKEFVAKANPPGLRRTIFFCNQPVPDLWRRSLGLSVFNESLTHCTLDDPRNVTALKLMHKWTYVDHLFPSAADRESFSTESGYGGATLQLFNSGNYAMFKMGRYALIQLREFGQLDLAVSEPPYAPGGLPNTSTGARAAAIYIGSKHKNLAKYFLAFLASEDYNMHIVKDADALPPNPAYTKRPEFLKPAAYPNEWGCHAAFAKAAQTIAIGGSYSPFVVPSVVQRLQRETTEGFMSDLYPAGRAAQIMADRINEEIDRTLREKPKLRPLYKKLRQKQRAIDRLRHEGKRVPAALIDNPFHRRYYKFKGWLAE